MGYVIKNCKNDTSFYIPTDKIIKYLTYKALDLCEGNNKNCLEREKL